jgi:hypothetical protein
MKYILSLLLVAVYCFATAQNPALTNDPGIPIPAIHFDAEGALIIKASASSSVNDFDFLVGKWKMHHRRLNRRLEGCKDWTEFDSEDEDVKILSGTANMDTYRTTEMPGMVGKLFEEITLRLFDPKTRLWSLYWVASNRGVLDPPMVGSYENGIGHFFAKDTYNGKNVIVMFRWDVRDKEHPNWGQAFSPDGGSTWEWNWYNVFTKVK